jgi:hypothetical protein
MTLICVRLDQSYSTPRLTALADSRASVRRPNKTYQTVSDTTVKLFAIPIRCHEGNCLTPVIGSWRNPYFSTVIGLGYSGSCFPALTIVEQIRTSLATLFCPDGDRPLPTPEGLHQLVARITESYFRAYKGTDSPGVWIVVFGLDQRRPWIGTVSWNEGELNARFEWAGTETLVCIGQTGVFEQYVRELRSKIERHKAGLQSKRRPPADDGFDYSKQIAAHDLADAKYVEEQMLRKIEAEVIASIGGVLQRLELGLDGDEVVAGLTQDDRPYLEGASCSVGGGANLAPAVIVQRMGRNVSSAVE